VIDPRRFGFVDLDEMAHAWLDGERFAAPAGAPMDIAAPPPDPLVDAEFAAAVARARSLRRVLASLPRVAAPPAVRAYGRSLAALRGPDAVALPPAARLVASLPRRAAPAGFADRVVAGVGAVRIERAEAVRVRAIRPSLTLVLRSALAAALLVAATLTLANREPRAAAGRSASAGARFHFEIASLRPGDRYPAVPGAAFDPILAPMPRRSSPAVGGRATNGSEEDSR
jgi:hypothetical protein